MKYFAIPWCYAMYRICTCELRIKRLFTSFWDILIFALFSIFILYSTPAITESFTIFPQQIFLPLSLHLFPSLPLLPHFFYPIIFTLSLPNFSLSCHPYVFFFNVEWQTSPTVKQSKKNIGKKVGAKEGNKRGAVVVVPSQVVVPPADSGYVQFHIYFCSSTNLPAILITCMAVS